MEPAIKEMIRSQTSEEDDLVIERIYHECGQDVVKTIMKISNIEEAPPKPETLFDKIRKICDDKDTVLQEKIAQSKGI